MTSSIINFIVDKYLSNILEINKEQTKSSIWKGEFEMSNIKSEDLIARLRNGTKLPALQALLNEAADKIAEQDEKISVACFYMKETNRAEDEGRVVLLDRETALAIAAGWRAIRTTTRLQGATYVYDPLGEDGGPYEIPYAKAGEILVGTYG